ncbi:uncharacterized protein [Branchiostoma lanceolatum]|uniref:uncharacterized protein n=1 Tax=Branchiostoma lanceolatum TaxID=7740 RepID=UPI0034570F4B
METVRSPPPLPKRNNNNQNHVIRNLDGKTSVNRLQINSGPSGDASMPTVSGNNDYDLPIETVSIPPQPPEPSVHYENQIMISDAATPDDGLYLNINPPGGVSRPTGSGNDDYDLPTETFNTPSEPGNYYQNRIIPQPEVATPDDGLYLNVGPPGGILRPAGSGNDDYEDPKDIFNPREPDDHYQELKPSVYQNLHKH